MHQRILGDCLAPTAGLIALFLDKFDSTLTPPVSQAATFEMTAQGYSRMTS